MGLTGCGSRPPRAYKVCLTLGCCAQAACGCSPHRGFRTGFPVWDGKATLSFITAWRGFHKEVSFHETDQGRKSRQICPVYCTKHDEAVAGHLPPCSSSRVANQILLCIGLREMNLISGEGPGRRQDKGLQGDSILCWAPAESWRRVEGPSWLQG